MRDDDFEWDDAKAAANLAKHKVTFEQGRLVFLDPSPVDGIDTSSPGEDRLTMIGMSEGKLLHVTYTDRDGRVRIISARKADRHERKIYHEGG